MKVKDLEPVLQEMIKREFNIAFLNRIAQPYLDQIEWPKMSDEERLAECRRRYKEGLVINCLHSVHKNWVVPNSFKIWGEEGIIRIWSNYGTGVCCLYYDGKFAEIVTEEKEKEETFIDDLIPNRYYIYHGDERDMIKGNKYHIYKSNPDYIELLDAYGQPHQFVRSEWPLFELVSDQPIETKEQIRTELINELIEWNNEEWNKQGSAIWCVINTKLNSLLPTETPEKIAERKAEEEWRTWCYVNGYDIDAPMLKDDFIKLRIEALLTDITK